MTPVALMTRPQARARGERRGPAIAASAASTASLDAVDGARPRIASRSDSISASAPSRGRPMRGLAERARRVARPGCVSVRGQPPGRRCGPLGSPRLGFRLHLAAHGPFDTGPLAVCARLTSLSDVQLRLAIPRDRWSPGCASTAAMAAATRTAARRPRDSGDDAGVYRLADDLALVQTSTSSPRSSTTPTTSAGSPRPTRSPTSTRWAARR